MMERRLQYQLGAIEFRLRRARLWRRLAFCWAATAGAELALLFIHSFTGWNTQTVLVAGADRRIDRGVDRVAARATASGGFSRAGRSHCAGISAKSAHLLSTAVEQEPDSESGEFGFLQLRVIEEALRASARDFVAAGNCAKTFLGQEHRQLAALDRDAGGAFCSAAIHICRGRTCISHRWLAKQIEVTPGDTQVERGSGLVISARFGGQPPPEAALVLVWASGKTQRLPMARNLADPIFGASLLEVSEDGALPRRIQRQTNPRLQNQRF